MASVEATQIKIKRARSLIDIRGDKSVTSELKEHFQIIPHNFKNGITVSKNGRLDREIRVQAIGEKLKKADC